MTVTLGGAKLPVKIWVDDLGEVESGALDQLRNTANLPWVKAVSAKTWAKQRTASAKKMPGML